MRPCPQCKTPCDETHKFCPSCGFPVGKVAINPDDPLIGRNLPGGYIILELVGIGGMGRVYRAEQTNLGRTVAVKIIHPHLVGEENAAARFITEARAASRLNHPNSVGVIDFGKTDDGQLYLVMEFLRGADLARVAYEEGPLPFRRIVNVLRQVLAALSEAHAMEIVHRDLKPENIIVEPTRSGADIVKVVDFGLAKMRADMQQPSITSPGIVCGTPEYMSPEQGRGDPLDGRSDLYAVGVILYQLLTGHLPFEGESATQVVLMHLMTAPRDPREVAPERRIPTPIVDVCLRALAKEPKDRYADADALSEALGAAMSEVEGARPPPARVPEITCSSCRAKNLATQKFCGECGAPLTPDVVRNRVSFLPEPDERTLPGLMGRRTLSGERVVTLPLPLLCREDDIAWLRERRSEARVSLTAACLVGEPGVGKTRLLEEFLTSSALAGDTVVRVGPDPSWAEVGYSSLRAAIAALAGLPPEGGSSWVWSAATAEARRGLADIFRTADGVSRPGELSPALRRFSAAEALRWAFSRASARAAGERIVVTVDDVHLIDGASRNAFLDVVREPPVVPALVVLAAAPGFEESLDGIPVRLLTGLPSTAIARLFQDSGARLTPSVAGLRNVLPLYLEQVVRFTREGGSGAPGRLADLLSLRVERLGAEARRALQAVAVLGDDTRPSMLRSVLPEHPDLASALDALRAGGMVDDQEGRLRTTHPLLREVVLATIPAAVRRELHAAAAEVCEAQNAPPEVLAVHAYFAQSAFQALVLLDRVSALAAARGDDAGAVLALRRGLELARREIFRGELDDPVRAVVVFSRKLGEALARQALYTDAEGVLREALDLAGPTGPDRVRVLGALAQVAHGRDRPEEAYVYLTEAQELARRSGSRELVQSLDELERSLIQPA